MRSTVVIEGKDEKRWNAELLNEELTNTGSLGRKTLVRHGGLERLRKFEKIQKG
jgi:hypothetical protein